MKYDPNNIFAKMLRGEMPCQRVLETPYGLAFHDIFPQAPVHALALPKGPYLSSLDFHQKASPDEITGFYRFLSEVIDVLNLSETGYRLLSNHGQDAGQEVPHYHVHILGGKPLGPLITSSDKES